MAELASSLDFFLHNTNSSDPDDNILNEIQEIFGDYQSGWSPLFRVFITTTYCFLTVCGLLANVLFCVVVYRCQKLHTVTHILMTNLAASNVLFLLLYPAYFMTTYLFESSWIFGAILCKLCLSISYITSTGSFYMMCLVAVDRWLAIFARKKRLDRHRCLVLTLLIWVISLAVASPYMYSAKTIIVEHTSIANDTTGEYRCGLQFQPESAMRLLVATIVVQYVMPLLIMVPAYIHLAYYLWSRPTVGIQTREKARKQLRRRRRLLATLLSIVGFLVACWLPLFIVNLMVVFNVQPEGNAQQKIETYIYASMVTLLGVFATPICYLMNDVFRQQTFALLGCMCPGLKYIHSRFTKTAPNPGTQLMPAENGAIDVEHEEEAESAPSTSLRSSRRGTPVDIALLPNAPRSALIRVCINPTIREKSDLELEKMGMALRQQQRADHRRIGCIYAESSRFAKVECQLSHHNHHTVHNGKEACKLGLA